jgi:hypothetical protein
MAKQIETTNTNGAEILARKARAMVAAAKARGPLTREALSGIASKLNAQHKAVPGFGAFCWALAGNGRTDGSPMGVLTCCGVAALTGEALPGPTVSEALKGVSF